MPVPRLILLAPIQPAPGGSGLAMRAQLFRRAAEPAFDVVTVVVPVAGELPPGAASGSGVVVVQPDAALARAGSAKLVGDARWRGRLSQVRQFPPLTRLASPGLAGAVAAALPAGEFAGLHAMRSYLAPLAVAIAEQIGIGWCTLDLDEDDSAFAASVGDSSLSNAYLRLLDTFGHEFGALSAASPPEAETMGRRHGLTVQVIPNAVELPATIDRRPRDERSSELLFVGNLTYAPNVVAARSLVQEVLPRVRERIGAGVRVKLVGPASDAVAALSCTEVEVTGYVPDLTPIYRDAAAVVVPLRAGAGTRIKLLEAFAHDVPVVASRTAAAGLAVVDGRHLLIANDPATTAAAVIHLLTDPALAGRLVTDAQRLVHRRYSTDAVAPTIRQFLQPPGVVPLDHPRTEDAFEPSR